MACRHKNEHRSRHSTHRVKGANSRADIFAGFPALEKAAPKVEAVAAPVVEAVVEAPAKPKAPRKKAVVAAE